VDTLGLDLALGGTTPLEGSAAMVDASTTGVDGNVAVEVLLPGELEAPGIPAPPVEPFGDTTPIAVGPVEVGGLGETTPVEPAQPTRPGLGTNGPRTPIGSGVGGFGSLAPLGTASGTGTAAELAALRTSAADQAAAGTGAAALAFTGFGIRNALSLALVLLALGALLLAGRRRVELLTVS
jgi:hypothetical protein